MKFKIFTLSLILLISGLSSGLSAQSVAREWNEVLLEAIRNDYARPTVHARNLFHTSIAMYDAWAAYDDVAETFLLGKTYGSYTCAFSGIPTPADLHAAREEAVSYAAYRILLHRFQNSPGVVATNSLIEGLMTVLGYDGSITSTDYSTGSAAALGNYIAENIIAFGLEENGCNEANDYDNQFYESVNDPLSPAVDFGNPNIADPNRWQALLLDVFIDQSGNEIAFNETDFLSPEWGQVTPFALQPEDATIYNRDGYDYWCYHDPGMPPLIDPVNSTGTSDLYKWGFELVSIWSSHLDPTDGVMWDISPASIGNVQSFPTDFADYDTFYNLLDGGDPSIGHDENPHTGQPYTPQMVPRADYARVLAEFWADGPDSETPPGHWFTLLNYVNDHPDFEKRFEGQGPILEDLEWDVKAYLMMGGTMHDCAIAAWGLKGWYDYIRPISAIRSLSDRGQSSDPMASSYHPAGITLIPGYIELVETGDPLAGDFDENVGLIKVYAWRGPDYIENEETDVAGVGWILAGDWWPYQRPTFVTPPFSGYVSGHSTYSRAAAEAMTLLTGDPFFPGGMGEFVAPMNEFLVFEDGPSQTITLQWATYRDASDQCSLSRIWGGIHPPADDIPGRLIGEVIGVDAFNLAKGYFYCNGSTEAATCEKPDFSSFYINKCDGSPIEITWDPIDGAIAYEFYGQSPNNGAITLSRFPATPGFNIPGTVPDGFTPDIQLRAQCADGCWTDWTTLSPYIVGCCASPDETTFTSSSCNSMVVFNWDPVVDAVQYEFSARALIGSSQLTVTVPNPTVVYNGGVPPNFPIEFKIRAQCPDGSWSRWTPLTTNTINCTAAPIPVNPDLSTEVDMSSFFETMSVYPNPADDILNIKINGIQAIGLRIMDVFGQQLQSNNWNESANAVDISTLSTGIYFVELTTDSGNVISRKFIKR